MSRSDCTSISNIDPNKALMMLRLIWFALLGGQLFFIAVVLALIMQSKQAISIDVGITLGWISLAGLFTAIPLGFFLRMQRYKAGWQNDQVMPGAYFQGNTVLFVMCEAVSILAIIGAMLSGIMLPTMQPPITVGVVPAILSMIVQVFNFPTGKPMYPAKNPFSPESVTKPFDGKSQL